MVKSVKYFVVKYVPMTSAHSSKLTVLTDVYKRNVSAVESPPNFSRFTLPD